MKIELLIEECVELGMSKKVGAYVLVLVVVVLLLTGFFFGKVASYQVLTHGVKRHGYIPSLVIHIGCNRWSIRGHDAIIYFNVASLVQFVGGKLGGQV